MPGWFKKLLNLLKVDFSLIKVDQAVFNPHLVNKPDAPNIRIENGRTEINLANLTPEQIESAKSIFREAFECGQTFVANKANEQIDGLREVESAPQNQAILSCLKPIISPEDYQALRASIFLRSQYNAGYNVRVLKLDIMQRFGERGRKISNLCSAGYFDGVPAQLEQAKKSPGFTQDKFRESFDRFVDESAFALFVKSANSMEETEKKILRQIKNNSSYGLRRLVVHGIGGDNIGKIRGAIERIIKGYAMIKSTEEQIGESILVDLRFPPGVYEILGNLEP